MKPEGPGSGCQVGRRITHRLLQGRDHRTLCDVPRGYDQSNDFTCRTPPGFPLIARTSSQTRMQVFTTSPAAMYTGIGNAFSRISATEGLRTLWRGVSSVILGAGPAHAVHFGTYEFIKELTGGNDEGSHWISTGESCILLPFEDLGMTAFPSHCWCLCNDRK